MHGSADIPRFFDLRIAFLCTVFTGNFRNGSGISGTVLFPTFTGNGSAGNVPMKRVQNHEYSLFSCKGTQRNMISAMSSEVVFVAVPL